MMYKIPVLKILLEAAWFLWTCRGLCTKYLVYPVLGLVCVWAFIALVMPQGLYKIIPIYAVYGFCFAWFAVVCHRLILVDPENVVDLNYKKFVRRVLKFLLWLILIYALYVVIKVTVFNIVVMFIGNLLVEGGTSSTRPEDYRYVDLIASIPGFYIVGRLALVLPAIAVDEVERVKWSWTITAGNGFRILILVGVLPWVLDWLVFVLWRENATLIEQTILGLLAYLLLALEVFLVSLAYKGFKSVDNQNNIEVQK